MLAGVVSDGEKRVLYAIPIENARRDAARNRYRMEGEDVRRAAEEAARGGAEIVGWYHSHPDAPAVPSATDRDEATWPFYSYVIASVREGTAGELRSWKLTEDRSSMVEEPILDDV